MEATASAEHREDGEDDALLQDPLLDNMLIRMEEIEVSFLLSNISLAGLAPL